MSATALPLPARARRRRDSLWGKAAAKFARDRVGLAALAVVLVYLLAAIGVWLGWWASEWGDLTAGKWEPVAADHWFGTNIIGQDIFDRAIYSTATAFEVGLVVALIATGVGAVLGAFSGFFVGSWIDELLLWCMGVLDAIPFYLFVAAVAYALTDNPWAMHVAMVSSFWVGTARLIRGEVIKLRGMEYVEAAHSIGVPEYTIIFRHILPNALHILLVQASILFVSAIKAEVILSFLGIGIKDGMSWGLMIDESTKEVLAGFYNNFLAASILMFGLVMAFNALADALQDALDPEIGGLTVAGVVVAGVTAPVLRVRDLTVEFVLDEGVLRAVDQVSFDVHENETLGLVGESGCGKTVTGLSVLRLIPIPPGRIAGGSIELRGRDLVPLPNADIEDVRGRDISMIFQEPMTALNPVFTIGTQMADVLRRHRQLSRQEARAEAARLLAKVNIPEAESRLDDHPHQLSGGMRQRVMIAMALSCNPQLLIADEPTTALDVTTQAQVLGQIKALQEEFRMAVLLVTHDLGVVAETCRRALVMYCGSIVESGTTADLFSRPQHPYTAGLLASIPRIRSHRLAELPVIPGRVPDLLNLPLGCRFADRCPRVQPLCRESRPPLLPTADGGLAACYFPIGAPP